MRRKNNWTNGHGGARIKRCLKSKNTKERFYMKRNILFSAFVLLVLAVFLAGCVSSEPVSQPTRSSASLRAETIVKNTVDAETSSSNAKKNSSGSSAAKNAVQGAGNSAAGNAKSTNLTRSDVRNFIDNYDAIFAIMNEESSMSYDEYEAELDRYGISGPNRAMKVAMIVRCQSVLMFDAEVQADPETAQILKSMGMDPMAEMRAETNADDLATVKPFYSELYVLFND
jgi:predicted enzyme related to lactoylglutathione lyase